MRRISLCHQQMKYYHKTSACSFALSPSRSVAVHTVPFIYTFNINLTPMPRGEFLFKKKGLNLRSHFVAQNYRPSVANRSAITILLLLKTKYCSNRFIKTFIVLHTLLKLHVFKKFKRWCPCFASCVAMLAMPSLRTNNCAVFISFYAVRAYRIPTTTTKNGKRNKINDGFTFALRPHRTRRSSSRASRSFI